MKAKKIRIVIADDHPIFRRGLNDILATESDLEVVGDAPNGARALELIQELAPDVAVLDIDIPVLDGLEVARILSDRRTDVKVIFLTIHRNRSLVRSMRRLGISGYVVKDAVTDEIVEGIRRVYEGETYVSKSLDRRGVAPAGDPSDSFFHEQLELLSEMEQKVLVEIARSRTNREIAEKHCISVRTVETHRYNICSKLGLKGPHALLRFAVSNRQAILADRVLSTTTDRIT